MKTNEKKPRKQRSDIGATHHAGTWGDDAKIFCFYLNGKHFRTFDGIRAAVDYFKNSSYSVSYFGIWACILGRQRKHGNLIWKSPKGFGRGYLNKLPEISQ